MFSWSLLTLILSVTQAHQAAPPAAQANDETTSEINDASSVVDLSGVWFFHEGDNPMFAHPSTDDRQWAPLRVPTDRVNLDRRWKGFGWYRRHVYVSSRVLGNDLMLTLGPAREVVEVYVNGTLLIERGRFGSRLQGEARVTPLRALLPQGVLKAGENVIAVRVYDPSYTCGLPSGPLLLGPPDAVLGRTLVEGNWVLIFRLSLAVLAMCLALVQTLVFARRSSPAGDPWWAAGAALSLALVNLAGTGVLTSTLPSLELAVRIPQAAQFCAILCIFNYFAARYDDFSQRRARAGRVLIGASAVFVFLAPDSLGLSAYLVSNPVCEIYALITVLYAAHLLAQAARRREPGSLILFASLLTLMAAVIYDGLVPSTNDMLPSWTATMGVFYLALTTLMTARQTSTDFERSLLRGMRLQKQIDGRVWMDILAATASAITRPQEFLEAVAHEVTREMEVRRCSIILPDTYGNLFIAACKGLPKQARLNAIQTGRSIAHFVYESGLPLTPATLPEHLLKNAEKPRQSNYDTNGFIAQPIRMGQRTLGVMSVSDRNNGGVFNADDEAHMAQVADRLALVLHRLDLRLEAILALSPMVVDTKPELIRAGAEPKGRAIGQVNLDIKADTRATEKRVQGVLIGGPPAPPTPTHDEETAVVISKNLS